MKRVQKMAMLDYEQPQMTILALDVERGFAASSNLEDMKETEGEWATY